MNPTLARIYGTGMSKTASDASAEAGELDLSQISAADFLAALEAEESEKVASDELDLSQISAEDLIALAEELDADESDPIEKMAQAGELDYWDAAGRVMAHAYADEMNKVAQAGDEVLDISSLSGQELLDLLESGEYDLVKEAGVRDYLRKLMGSAASAVSSATGSAPKVGKSSPFREAAEKMTAEIRSRPQIGTSSGGRFANIKNTLRELATGEQAALRKVQGMAPKAEGTSAYGAKAAKKINEENFKKALFRARGMEYGKRAAGVGATGLGSVYLYKKRKK